MSFEECHHCYGVRVCRCGLDDPPSRRERLAAFIYPAVVNALVAIKGEKTPEQLADIAVVWAEKLIERLDK